MASRDFDLAGRGAVHLASGALAARTNIVLSQELTSIVFDPSDFTRVTMTFVLRGKPQAGLPALNTGALIGFLIGFYLEHGTLNFYQFWPLQNPF